MGRKEAEVWRELGEHPNIVRFFEVEVKGDSEVMILNELCTGGTLFQHISSQKDLPTEEEVLRIFKEIVLGVKHMHQKAVAHRDLKVENVIKHEGKWKLCDFGSCSSETLDYHKCTKSQIANALEEYEKYTTLMYRPPEMMDQYLGFTVNLKVDIWMLGCILYSLCFHKHPFQDSQSLAIINAHYYFPAPSEFPHISPKMKDFIRTMLTPNPIYRPSIFDIEHTINNFEK